MKCQHLLGYGPLLCLRGDRYKRVGKLQSESVFEDCSPGARDVEINRAQLTGISRDALPGKGRSVEVVRGAALFGQYGLWQFVVGKRGQKLAAGKSGCRN